MRRASVATPEYDDQQHGRVLDRVQRVTLWRDLEEIAGPALPRVATCANFDPTPDHVDGRLARVLVLGHRFVCQQRNNGLPHRSLVSADDGS